MSGEPGKDKEAQTNEAPKPISTLQDLQDWVTARCQQGAGTYTIAVDPTEEMMNFMQFGFINFACSHGGRPAIFTFDGSVFNIVMY
jgi:hypothetical protein